MNLVFISSTTFSVAIILAILPIVTVSQNTSPHTHPLSQVARLISQAMSPPHYLEDDVHNIQQGLFQLSLPEVQRALLQSLQEDHHTGSGAGSVEVKGGIQLEQNTSALCQNHTVALIVGLLNRTHWAVQMLDAMGKPGPGVTEGNFYWPGAYKQCLNVRANTTVPQHPHFSGQYCTAAVIVAPPSLTAPFGTQMMMGLCAPDTCSDSDLTFYLRSYSSCQHGFTLAVKGLKENLTTKSVAPFFSLIIVVCTSVLMLRNLTLNAVVTCSQQNLALDAKAIVAIVICSIFLFFIVMGTAMDIFYIQMPKWRKTEKLYTSANGYTSIEESTPLLFSPNSAESCREPGLCAKIIMAFSVYTNGTKLLSTKKVPGSLDCIHGVRFLSMTWVVLGHAFVFPLLISVNTFPYLKEVMKRWSFQAIGNAVVSVDSFFTLSGLLVAYLSLKEMKKKNGKINWFMFYFHRFWRLTPVYMLVLMIYVCLHPYMGEGPLWLSTFPDRDNCKESWWANLLYINNLAKTKELCMGQSWYLANDMQFYILSPLIFVPLFFLPWLGAVSALIFLLITAIVPGVLTMRDHFPPSMLPGQLAGNNTDTQDYMNDFYIKPYNRMGPYIVGMLAGYFLYHTDCKLHINKVVNLLVWAVATGCALAVLYGLYDASNGHPVTLPVSAFYNAVNRQVWAACVCWVIVACVTGNGGFVNTILSWPALVPLSRLTYTIYLLHMMLINIYLYNRNTLFYFDDMNIVMFFLSILVVSYMAAAVTSLAFEAPMMALEKILFHTPRKDDGKNNDGKDGMTRDQPIKM